MIKYAKSPIRRWWTKNYGLLVFALLMVLLSVLFIFGVVQQEKEDRKYNQCVADLVAECPVLLWLQVAHDHGCPVDNIKLVASDDIIYVYRVVACGRKYWYKGVDIDYGVPARFQWDRHKDAEKEK